MKGDPGFIKHGLCHLGSKNLILEKRLIDKITAKKHSITGVRDNYNYIIIFGLRFMEVMSKLGPEEWVGFIRQKELYV